MAGSLFRTKSIDVLMAESRATGEGTLKRTLGAWSLSALGIGALIGAAASCLDPVPGEGIYEALRADRMAAPVVVAAIRSARGVLYRGSTAGGKG